MSSRSAYRPPFHNKPVFVLVEVDDEKELRKIFDDNRQKINMLVKKISQEFKRGNFPRAKTLIAEIKYYLNIEEKIKSRTYFH